MFKIIKKIHLLFNKKQKRQVLFLQMLMIIGAIMETLSISLVVPLVLMIISGNQLSGTLGFLFNKIHFSESNNTAMLLVAIIVVIITKNLFLSFQYWFQSRFTSTNRKTIKRQLLEAYFKRPYEELSFMGSGEVIKSINNDTDGTFSLISAYLRICTEIFVISAVFVTLFFIDGKMTVIITGFLILEVLFVSKIIDPISRKTSKVYRTNTSIANSYVIQAFRGIKAIKVSQKEKFFLDKYDIHSSEAIEAEVKSAFVSSLPRNVIEALTMSGMLLYVLIVFLMGEDVSLLVPTISAFAVAAVRLIPSFNRITSQRNVIVFNESKLDNLIESLKYSESCQCNFSGKQKKNLPVKKSFGLKNVSFSYLKRDNKILENVNLDIPVGSFVGIVGLSGAGKTTAVDIILGLLKPQKGYVYTDDVDVSTNYSSWLDHIGYIPQDIYIFSCSIKSNIAFGIKDEEIENKKVIQALKAASLWSFVDSLPDGIETVVGEGGSGLSGGQKQRLGIARALYKNPDILIFDEATSSLDNETEKDIMKSINSLRGKKTIIVIAHRLTTIEKCDTVYRIKNGKISVERKES